MASELEDDDLEALRNAALATLKPKTQPIQQVISGVTRPQQGLHWNEFPASADIVSEYHYQPEPLPEPDITLPLDVSIPPPALRPQLPHPHARPWHPVFNNGVKGPGDKVFHKRGFSSDRRGFNRVHHRSFGDGRPINDRGRYPRRGYVTERGRGFFQTGRGRGLGPLVDTDSGVGNLIVINPQSQARKDSQVETTSLISNSQPPHQTNAKPKLILPQDKYHSTSPAVPSMTEISHTGSPQSKPRDKFSRYNDSGSEDDEDDWMDNVQDCDTRVVEHAVDVPEPTTVETSYEVEVRKLDFSDNEEEKIDSLLKSVPENTVDSDNESVDLDVLAGEEQSLDDLAENLLDTDDKPFSPEKDDTISKEEVINDNLEPITVKDTEELPIQHLTESSSSSSSSSSESSSDSSSEEEGDDKDRNFLNLETSSVKSPFTGEQSDSFQVGILKSSPVTSPTQSKSRQLTPTSPDRLSLLLNNSTSPKRFLSPDRISQEASPQNITKRTSLSPRNHSPWSSKRSQSPVSTKRSVTPEGASSLRRKSASPNICSPKSYTVSPRKSSSPQRQFSQKQWSPQSPSGHYTSPYRYRSPLQRSFSPRRSKSPSRKPSQTKWSVSPDRRNVSPPRRSPRNASVSPRRPLSPTRKHFSPKRYLSPLRRQQSPLRRCSPPLRRPFSPIKRSSPPRTSKSPPRRPLSPVRRPLSPVRRPLSPVRRPLSPARRPLSPARRPVSPSRRPVSPSRRPVSPSRRPVSPLRRPVSPLRRPVSPSRRPLSPSRRPVSPLRRPVSPSRRPVSPSRRPLSPSRRPTSPLRRPASPSRRPVSPSRRRLSPSRQPLSPPRRVSSPLRKPLTPTNRSESPRQNSPRISPHRRNPARDDRRLAKGKGYTDRHLDSRSQKERYSRDSESKSLSQSKEKLTRNNRDSRLNRSRSREKKVSSSKESPGRRDKSEKRNNRSKSKETKSDEPPIPQLDLNKLTPDERAKIEARMKKFSTTEIKIDPAKKVSLKSIKERSKKRKKSKDEDPLPEKRPKKLSKEKYSKHADEVVAHEQKGNESSSEESQKLVDLEDESDDSETARSWRQEGNKTSQLTLTKSNAVFGSLDRVQVSKEKHSYTHRPVIPRKHRVRERLGATAYPKLQHANHLESDDSDDASVPNRLTSSVVTKKPFRHDNPPQKIIVQIPGSAQKQKKKSKTKPDFSKVYSIPAKRKAEQEEESSSVLEKKTKKKKKEKKKKKHLKEIVDADDEGPPASEGVIVQEACASVELPSVPSRPSVYDRLGKKVPLTQHKEKKKKKKKKNQSNDEDSSDLDAKIQKIKEENAIRAQRQREIELDKEKYG
ncbi:serine/arginine repetitive matrix protein 2-like [Physella acuta]|uniref:serine/arginine repetitive matrix protein 2-like n=1 Tax=Physella acuta TaxID=109671 RepID=UPI0027DDB1F6|nr:serine/arginine repetitive matrix protein 2-like [Physella acuta]